MRTRVSLPGPALLFCPADRPERYAKAVAAADVVIIDLEDAVAPDRKGAAREALVGHQLDPDRVVVRVNAVGTDDHRLDLMALRQTDYRTVMLPKAEHPDDAVELADWSVLALCETPRGALQAPAIAAATNVVGLMWGAEDLIAAIGGSSSRQADGTYRAVATHVRSAVLLAAAASGVAAIDSVYLDFADDDGLLREAQDAAASGFAAKACIHPRQGPVIQAAFRPSDDEISWARTVLAAGSDAGVVAVDGRMVDAPLLEQARRTIARAGRA
jgi:citrate lyase subunit beta/citryl-CoA lyase